MAMGLTSLRESGLFVLEVFQSERHAAEVRKPLTMEQSGIDSTRGNFLYSFASRSRDITARLTSSFWRWMAT